MTASLNEHLRSALLLFVVTTLLVFSYPSTGLGQDIHTSVVVSNANITVEAGANCTTIIRAEMTVINVGATPLDSFPFRADVRDLEMLEAFVGEMPVNATKTLADRYVILTFPIPQLLQTENSTSVAFSFRTMCLQEQIGESSDGLMYVHHLILYVRPLYEIRNMTVYVAMPRHAVLEREATAPLFPKPTSNHTDGFRTIYVWSIPTILTGQESVYIVKYELPIGIAPTVADVLAPEIVVVLAAVAGGLVVLAVERTPRAYRALRNMKRVRYAGVSANETEVLQFISQKGGSCSQREIYEQLNLSQSMVSTLLSTLEQRGVVRRFKEGRENMVHIMEK